jgi:aminoglycoside phosphotransferase (APT) family kinase protein
MTLGGTAMAHELDLDGLMARANAAALKWSPGVSLVEPTRLTGGASSITYWARVVNGPPGIDKVVLKWAPPGLEPVRNRDVLRQARCLRALTSLGSVVPSIYFDDAGEPPAVPPMFAMTFVAGDSCEPNLDADPELPTPSDLRTRALSSAHILAALHNVRPDQVGLADEPEVSISDEIDRWAAALASVPSDFCPGAPDLEQRLRERMPAPMTSSVIHGDFRLGNMLCVGPDVLAVIDWEIWARSDPRIDLGWYLLNADPAHHPSAKREAPGMPGAEELLAEYRAGGGPAVSDMDYFLGLTLYKMSAVVSLIAKNMIKRGDPDGIGARSRESLPTVMEMARQAVG